MFRILIFPLFLSIFCFSELDAAKLFSSYPKELEGAVQKIYQLEEVHKLLKEVSSSGSVRIALSQSNDFQAFWDSNTRTIYLNPKQHLSEGEEITSIVFELHNALSDRALRSLTDRAFKGALSIDAYVELVEKREYDNAVKTSKLLDLGIERKIFPLTAEWKILHHFDDHYLLQQLGGHSQNIAYSYQAMQKKRRKSAYKGTLSATLKKLRGKSILFLSVRNDLRSDLPEEVKRAEEYLEKEQRVFERLYFEGTEAMWEEGKNQLRALRELFASFPVYHKTFATSFLYRS